MCERGCIWELVLIIYLDVTAPRYKWRLRIVKWLCKRKRLHCDVGQEARSRNGRLLSRYMEMVYTYHTWHDRWIHLRSWMRKTREVFENALVMKCVDKRCMYFIAGTDVNSIIGRLKNYYRHRGLQQSTGKTKALEPSSSTTSLRPDLWYARILGQLNLGARSMIRFTSTQTPTWEFYS